MLLNQDEIYKIYGPSDEILVSLSRYEDSKKTKDYLRERRYSMKEIKDTISYRIVNHWCEKGLVDRKTENNWLKLSLVDIVWIKIVAKLRSFGVALEKIKTIKDNIFFFASDNKEQTYFLDLFILFALWKRSVGLVVLEDGRSFLCNEQYFQFNTKIRWHIKSYLYISLNEIVQAVFPKAQLDFVEPIDIGLSGKEIQLLDHIKNGNYEKVTVRLNNGDIVLFEGKEQINTKSRIIDILKTADYQNIELKAAKGKVINIIRTEKKKF